MPLFKLENKKAKKVSPIEAQLERDIQRLFENNLQEILDINFLATEYSTNTGRIDTLGIDNNGAPVIIEYKKTQNDNVINQGLSYLRWLLDHKEAFEKLVREKLSNLYDSPIMTYDGQLKESDYIDWSSPRVICVAPSYNKFDLDTVDLLPINIELLKYQLYGEDLLLVQPETQQKLRISTSKIVKKEKTTIERETHTMEEHYKNGSKETLRLFELLKEKIMSLDDDISEEPKKNYIAYKLATNFTDIEIKKQFLKLFVNMPSGKLNDPHKIARDMTNPPTGHWGNGDYEIKLGKEEDIDKVFDLINQSYYYNK